MLGQIIDEKNNIQIGMDTYDHQYYVYDKVNRTTRWFHSLGNARTYFEREVAYRERITKQ